MKLVSKLISGLLICGFTLVNSVALGQSQYEILFEKIDNRVEVFVGDSLVYDSGYIGMNPWLKIHVGLDHFLQPGTNKLTVVLHNGRPTENKENTTDKHWEIRYEIWKDSEAIEYLWESNDDYEYGQVYSQDFILEN